MLSLLQSSNESAPDSNAAACGRRVDPDELKAVVRDGMILMGQAEREQLTRDLERELDHLGMRMSSHMIMIGIPAASHSELTPNEVGHFVRFLNLTAPRLMPAIERVLARHIAFLREEEPLQPAA